MALLKSTDGSPGRLKKILMFRVGQRCGQDLNLPLSRLAILELPPTRLRTERRAEGISAETLPGAWPRLATGCSSCSEKRAIPGRHEP